MKAPLLATWFGVALLISLIVLFSIQEQEARSQQNRIAELIAHLDNPNPQVRERVADELLAIGPEAAAPLWQAIPDPSSPHHERFREVYNRVAIHQPGGECTNGVKLCLRAGKESVRPGETVMFTTTMCNLDDDAGQFSLRVAQHTHFEGGWGFRRVPEGNDLIELSPECLDREMRLAYRLRVASYGSTLPPRSSVSHTMPAVLVCEKGRCFFLLGGQQKLELEVPSLGIARFRMVFSHSVPSGVVPASISHSGSATLPLETVTVRSNDVLLRILPPAPGYAAPSRPMPAPAPVLRGIATMF